MYTVVSPKWSCLQQTYLICGQRPVLASPCFTRENEVIAKWKAMRCDGVGWVGELVSACWPSSKEKHPTYYFSKYSLQTNGIKAGQFVSVCVLLPHAQTARLIRMAHVRKFITYKVIYIPRFTCNQNLNAEWSRGARLVTFCYYLTQKLIYGFWLNFIVIQLIGQNNTYNFNPISLL